MAGTRIAHATLKGPSVVKEIAIGIVLGIAAGSVWKMHHWNEQRKVRAFYDLLDKVSWKVVVFISSYIQTPPTSFLTRFFFSWIAGNLLAFHIYDKDMHLRRREGEKDSHVNAKVVTHIERKRL
ncbi:Cytochrome c oxidase subunitC [Sesamum angolense]|uniref:Cytochrome c oxidase subunitC n=1 Tax=Sesamum angolense TaxID=2727404 RepID=A0AAE2BP92_9LAMI|nr:Cytochrome c oxidase subunitC [Sesamum angolense]